MRSLLTVVAIDLIERRVARAARIAAIVQPFGEVSLFGRRAAAPAAETGQPLARRMRAMIAASSRRRSASQDWSAAS